MINSRASAYWPAAMHAAYPWTQRKRGQLAAHGATAGGDFPFWEISRERAHAMARS
jgi:hypothetical protein